MFTPVPNNVKFPALEEEILAFWKSSQIYEKTLQQRAALPNLCSTKGRRPPTVCLIRDTA